MLEMLTFSHFIVKKGYYLLNILLNIIYDKSSHKLPKLLSLVRKCVYMTQYANVNTIYPDETQNCLFDLEMRPSNELSCESLFCLNNIPENILMCFVKT